MRTRIIFYILLCMVSLSATAKQYPKIRRVLPGNQFIQSVMDGTPYHFTASLPVSDPAQLNTTDLKTSYQNTVELIIRNPQAFKESFSVTVETAITYHTIGGQDEGPKPLSLTIDVRNGSLQKEKVSDVFAFINAYRVELTITHINPHDVLDQNGVAVSNPSDDFLTQLINSLEINVGFQADVIRMIHYNQVVSNLSACQDARTDELIIRWGKLPEAEEYELEYTFADDYGNNFSSPLPSNQISYDFRKNSSRVSLRENYYRFPLLYERGYILYRVRAIGRGGDNLDLPVFCKWSGGNPSGLVSDFHDVFYHRFAHMLDRMNWQVTSAFAEEGKRSDVVNYYDGTFRARQTVTGVNLERNALTGPPPPSGNGIDITTGSIDPMMNEVEMPVAFQETPETPEITTGELQNPVSKEEFRRKKNLTPAGQSVAKSVPASILQAGSAAGCIIPGPSKFREVIAGETIYDFQGRPAVTILPAPTNSQRIRFIPRLNLSSATSAPYSWADFDDPSYLCTQANALSSVVNASNGLMGAAGYYSPNNSNKLGYNAFIPDALGFPFTQVSYLQDNTGRVAAQGGVGELYQLGNGHETRYYYAAPDQEELDRLFGTQVGDATRYQKNAVMNPNGQVSVTYLNPEGKAIATALAGETPEGPDGTDLVDPLINQNERTIRISLLNKNILNEEDKTLITEHQFLVTADRTPYTIEYILTPEMLKDEDCNGKGFCLDCIYDIEISLQHVESCASEPLLSYSGTIGDFVRGQSDLDCQNSASTGNYPRSTTLDLNIGTYILKKKITVNREAAVAYVDEVFRDTCMTVWKEILSDEMSRVDTTDCYSTCLNCDNPPVPTEDCNPDYCDPLSNRCDIIRNMMKADISPGGQYAQYDRLPNGTIDASGYPLSIFNEDNFLPFNLPQSVGSLSISQLPQQINIFGYLNHLQNQGLIPAYNSGLGYKENLTNLVNNWIPECTETLLQLHPESCKLKWCDEPDILETLDFDTEILGLDHFDEAEDAGYVSAGYPHLVGGTTYPNAYEQLIGADPWFAANSNAVLKQDLLNKLRNYGCLNLNPGSQLKSIDVLAMEMAYCAYKNPVTFQEGSTPQIDAGAYPCTLPGSFNPANFGIDQDPQYRDLEWKYLRALYLSAKNEIIEQEMESPNIGNCNTTCIGTPFFFSALINTTPPPCITNYNLFLLYLDKDRRFGSGLPALVNSMNESTMTVYQSLNDPFDFCENAQNIVNQSGNINTYISDNLCGNAENCDRLTAFAIALKEFLNGIFQYRILNTTFPSYTWLLDHLPELLMEKDGHPVTNVSLSNVIQGVPFSITLFYPYGGNDNPCSIELFGDPIPDWNKVRLILSITPVPTTQVTNEFEMNVLYGDYPVLSRITIKGKTTCWPVNECVTGTTLCDLLPGLPRSPYKNDCVDRLLKRAFANAQHRYNAWIDSSRNDLLNRYYAKCLSAVESLNLSYTDKEYQYTLFYYDQAGNLVKTVPPSGVRVLDQAQTAQVAASRAHGYNTAVLPQHVKYTVYRYNTLNQPVWQSMPDAGVTEFYYDGLGRIVASRNAKQKIEGDFSYTKYDPLGRIVEAGRVHTNAITRTLTRDFTGWSAFIDNQTDRREITFTRYDYPYAAFISHKFGPGGQRNLRSRVASVFLFDDASKLANKDYTHATHYTYDIMGNVYKLIQDYPNGIIGDKVTQYRYDLQSGKVNEVVYQQGAPDQFMHRCSYDASNRLTKVSTSTGGLFWESDAEYFYYRHGPLARVELGTDNVQGLDYLYTLQGFIKAVNGIADTAIRDAGQDALVAAAPLPGAQAPPASSSLMVNGQLIQLYTAEAVRGPGFTGPGYGNLNQPVARDAFGYVLDYYPGDYTPIAGNGCLDALEDYPPAAGTWRPLYNGNISRMYTRLQPFGNLGFSYSYDQLNRLTAQEGWELNETDSPTLSSSGDAYRMNLTYDPDGNILRMLRNGEPGRLEMDSLHYFYYLKNFDSYNPETNIPPTATNRLAYLTDKVAEGTYAEDLDDQDSDNYGYDPIGNLVRDDAGGIDRIDWNLQNKVSEIRKSDGTLIRFDYDALGNRVMKQVTGGSQGNATTFYGRDAQGNILSIYVYKSTNGSTEKLFWDETPLYGSSRIGVFRPEREIPKSVTTTYGTGSSGSSSGSSGQGAVINFHSGLFASFVCQQQQQASQALEPVSLTNILETHDSISHGFRLYELTNHLGNVLATITDRKLPVDNGTFDANGVKQNPTPDGLFDFYKADIASCQDYYPFGMIITKYNTQAGSYRFGYNKLEMDNEISGIGHHSTAMYWEYDTRMGRRWNVDPVVKENESSYACFANNPIYFIDMDGRDSTIYLYSQVDGNNNPYFSKAQLMQYKKEVDKQNALNNMEFIKVEIFESKAALEKAANEGQININSYTDLVCELDHADYGSTKGTTMPGDQINLGGKDVQQFTVYPNRLKLTGFTQNQTNMNVAKIIRHEAFTHAYMYNVARMLGFDNLYDNLHNYAGTGDVKDPQHSSLSRTGEDGTAPFEIFIPDGPYLKLRSWETVEYTRQVVIEEMFNIESTKSAITKAIKIINFQKSTKNEGFKYLNGK